ncbi:MAG: hypothetical protein JXB88_24985 [Spirochaetales bacterium]|nr:hypothetical protein [Spirochaetales bacterium]
MVNITSPDNNSTHTGTLLITGTAFDNKAVRKVELKLYEMTVGGDLYLNFL